MPQWVSAARIVEEYAVGEAKLLEYSARGNLPCRRELDGQAGLYFDRDHVARFFRVRSADAPTRLVSPHMGTLGAVKLGGDTSPVARRQPLVRHGKSARAPGHARDRQCG